MGCSEGDGIGPRDVSLGPFRAVHVAKGPKGETLDARGVSLGLSRAIWRAGLPREAARATDSGPETSPLVRPAAKSVALGLFRGIERVRAAVT